jgi:hypothetical protein
MRSLPPLLLAVLAALFARDARASEWLAFDTTDRGTAFIDLDSIANKGNYVQAWIKIEYHPPQKMKTYPYKEYDNAKSLWAFSCAEKTMAAVQEVGYLGGEVVGSWSVPPREMTFTDIAPDTLGESAFRIACPK